MGGGNIIPNHLWEKKIKEGGEKLWGGGKGGKKGTHLSSKRGTDLC